MWNKLHSIFEQKSTVSVHLLQQRFLNYKYDGEDISTLFSKIEEMVNQLKSLGETVSDKMIMTKVLMSIPDRFNHFISAWESVPTKKQTLDNLSSRLLIEEERLGNRSEESTKVALT
uniref:Copia protein n=1 Tax=Clastoptera arizonana TaxID=38151 RepID=A0A1B6BYY1_9HEMI